MKIIKEGKIKERQWRTEQFECSECGCVFEAEKGEYSARPLLDKAMTRFSIVLSITCPYCHTVIRKIKAELPISE